MKKFKTISSEDMELFHVVDGVDEAFKYITKNARKTNVRQI
jgi:hypothetical protein